MNSFANAMNNESRKTYTENGAQAYNSTSDACLDLFGSIGALREHNNTEVETLFAEAFKADPLLATKILFYARDIREGCGERKTFRTLIRYMANKHPEAIKPNMDLIGVFGRYDDLYSFIGTPLEDDMWAVMKAQFEEDVDNYNKGNAISLLAKWIKTPDASSKKTRALGIQTAIKLGYSVYDFKRVLRKLRKHLDIVESYMSAGEWDKITYSAVPSRAMMIYRNAFMTHDTERFCEFTKKALTGEEKINASTLFPYDIVEKYLYKGESDNNVLEAQWKALPNYVEEGTNAIVMADVSGSMYGRPMATSIALAMYFAERNVGDFHNLFMTFTSDASIISMKGETLSQKINNISKAPWGGSTNLEAAFDKVLDVAVKNHIPQSEMVKSIIVISDMEIDMATGEWWNRKTSDSWSFYDQMKDKYVAAGYEIPNIVFWNVNSRNNVFHADSTRKGVQLCSGSSATTFKQLMECIGMTPIEMMLKVINSERYSCITIG